MVCTLTSHPQFYEKTSREPWPHPYLSELPLLHGEKFLTVTTENLETVPTSEYSNRNQNLVDNMIKVEMIDLEEAQALLAGANPHDPAYPEQLMHLNILVSSSQLQDQDSFDATVYSAKSECPTPVGDCYDSSLTDSNDIQQHCSAILPQLNDTPHLSQSVDSLYIRRNSMRMEEFQDLDVNGLPAMVSDPGLEPTDAKHELNTPVFEKSNPFDVDLTATVRSLSQSSIISNSNNINQQQSTDNYLFNYVIKEEPTSDRSWFLDSITEPSYTINVSSGINDNNNTFSEAGSSFFWPSALKPSVGIKTSFIQENVQTIGDESANSVDKIDVLDEFIIRARDSYEDDFNDSVYKRECFSSSSSECSVDVNGSVPPRLILPEVGTNPNIFSSNKNTVNTPDVITTIEEIEADHKQHDSDGFNILQFISEQDIVTSSNIIDSLEIPPINTTSTSNVHTDSYGRSRADSKTSKSSYTSTISKSSRRKRNSYDDDEEYLPPTKASRIKRVTQKPKTLIEYESDLEYSSSSDDNTSDSDETVGYGKNRSRTKSISQKRKATTTNTNVGKRGRPLGSKQITSTLLAPADKYRDMRDKNNEASRKSRLKKKLHDSNYFVEVDELEARNVQLKARVSELQKTVENHRANLMKVMLYK